MRLCFVCIVDVYTCIYVGVGTRTECFESQRELERDQGNSTENVYNYMKLRNACIF